MTADMPAARILIVEAETTIARFVSDALKEEGFTVFIEGTLKEGLTACSTRQPDLVVVDLGLPDGDGLDLIGSFRTFSTASGRTITSQSPSGWVSCSRVCGRSCGAARSLIRRHRNRRWISGMCMWTSGPVR